jgi:RNA recognition motif-containing protein
MSAVHRVYVGGLPPSSSAEELSALINKIVPVSSIYFPDVSVTGESESSHSVETKHAMFDLSFTILFLLTSGLHRGFAIVSIAGTSEQLSKCMEVVTEPV